MQQIKQIIWCFLWKAQFISKSIAKASKIPDANNTYGKRILADWISSNLKILFLDLRHFSDVSSSKSPVCFFCNNLLVLKEVHYILFSHLHLIKEYAYAQTCQRIVISMQNCKMGISSHRMLCIIKFA